MKKLLAVVALFSILVACNNKKKEATKTEDNTVVPTTTEPTTTDPSTSATVSGVPSFSDPEIQKFANDYAAFITEYKAGIKNPARLEALTKNMQDWSTRGQSIGMKLASNPSEAKKWSDWWLAVTRDLYPASTPK